jgi:hypothetical protein
MPITIVLRAKQKAIDACPHELKRRDVSWAVHLWAGLLHDGGCFPGMLIVEFARLRACFGGGGVERMEIFIGVVIGILNVLLILKSLEMATCGLWILNRGPLFVRDVRDAGQRLNPVYINEALQRHEYPFPPGNMPVTRFLSSLYRSRIARPIIAFTFRHVVLTVFCAAFVLTRPVPELFGPKLRLVSSCILLIGAWVKMAHIAVGRFTCGELDNYLIDLSVLSMRASVRPDAVELGVRRLMSLYVAIFIVLILSYAASVSVIATGTIQGNSIKGIDGASSLVIPSIYFSTATLCTVGYGDLVPFGPVAQLLSISEMMCGFLFLVILLAAFSATVSFRD